MLIIRKQCVQSVKGEGECLQRMVNEFLHVGPPLSMRDMRMVPKSDIYDTADAILVFVELPGVEEQDVQIAYDTESDILAIYGRRNNPMAEMRKRILQKETVTGSFEKLLKIHVPVDTDNITADLRSGILAVTLPKP